MPELKSLSVLSDEVRTLLRDHAVENFYNESRWIMAEILNLSVTQLLHEGDRLLDASDVKNVWSAAQRRAAGEPLSYVLGTADFGGLEFNVDSRVLIPRPETERIVDIIAVALKDSNASRCLELGVGSGCLAISLLRRLPKLTMVATDLSAAALDVCRLNAEKHGVLERLELIETSIFESVPHERFDWILSNPPYIAENDPRVAEDVRRYEPSIALFASADGLAMIEGIATDAQRFLAKRGRLIVEHGDGQSDAVRDIFLAEGFQARCLKDVFGRMRFVEAWL